MAKYTFYNDKTGKPEFKPDISLEAAAAALWAYETQEESMSFGDTLAKLRKNSGMTQYDLSVEIGQSRSVVAAWESDKRMPSISAVSKLSKLFDTNKLLDAYERYDTKKHSANKLRITKLKKQLEKERD